MTKRLTQVFLGLMAIAFCKVGIEALVDPQAVVAPVGIVLDNSSATASMRAVYGGMHLVFGLFCVWGIFKDMAGSLQLVCLYTAGFAIGRITDLAVTGAPNSFVLTWLATEMVSFGVAIVLLRVLRRA